MATVTWRTVHGYTSTHPWCLRAWLVLAVLAEILVLVDW